MPSRLLIPDKAILQTCGFNFIGPNGTYVFAEGKSRFHISVHGEGNPPQWDRFHVKVADLRFGTPADHEYHSYTQQANAEGTTFVTTKGLPSKAEQAILNRVFADWMKRLGA